MSWAVTAVGAAISIGTTIYSNERARKASSRASEAALQGQQEALDTEWEMFQQTREDYAPWRESGKEALTTLKGQIAAGPGTFDPKKQPGYEFGFKNFIEKPYLSSQSAKGKRLSGETIKGLTKYAGDYAETSYDNFLNRYYQRLNPLFSMAGLGQQATQGTVQAGTNLSNNMAQIQSNMGQTQAQNFLNQGNIQTGTAGAIGGVAQNMVNNYLQYSMLKKVGAFGSGGTT